MVWEFQCPVNDCDFSSTGNEEGAVVEKAQQHMGDKHDNMPTRDEVEGLMTGPG